MKYQGKTWVRYPHVRKLLLERYLFRLPDEFAAFYPNFTQKVKVKSEWITQQDGMSAQVFHFDHPDGEEVLFETFEGLARRVSNRIASGIFNAPTSMSDEEKRRFAADLAEKVERLMLELKFLPSSPFMFNAGRGADEELLRLLYKKPDELTIWEWKAIASIKDPAYGSCYALGEIGDSIDEIFDMLRTQAEVFRHAGGFGVNFSKLRSKYAWVSTIKGHSSGPLMFMRLFNENTYIIALHASTKRGANMFLLDIDHPEIEEFIDLKTDFEDNYQNMRFANISVGFTDAFFDALFEKRSWLLIDPHDKSIKIEKDPAWLWGKFVMNAAMHAEPGFINWDIINANNPFRKSDIEEYKRIKSVNPCVVGDTKVLTKRGLVNAKDLKVGDYVWDPISGQFQRVEKVYDKGEKEVLKIVIDTGAEIVVTPDHHFVLPDGSWKKAAELKEGETIVVGEAPDFDYEGNDAWIEDIATELGWTKEEAAWLLGVFLGDGTIEKTRVVFTLEKNSEIVVKITELFKKGSVHFTINEKEYNAVQYATSDELVRKLCGYVLKDKNHPHTKGNKAVPEELFTSSSSVVAAFVAGYLDSDGSIFVGSKQRIQVAIVSVQKEILQEVQKLWQLLGGFSTITHAHKNRHDFVDKRVGKVYSAQPTYRILLSVSRKAAFRKIKQYLVRSRNKKGVDEILKRQPKNYKNLNLRKIVSIQPAGKAQVYDATIPPNYVWVTNTVLTGDCSEFVSVNNSVCVLGSMNLLAYVDDEHFDMESFKEDVKTAHAFLTISDFANEFPLPQLTENTRKLRNTGLGIMGAASTLVALKLRYGSMAAYNFLDHVMFEMAKATIENSNYLAHIIGPHYGFEQNANAQKYGDGYRYSLNEHWRNMGRFVEIDDAGLANAFMMAIAPTGSISFIANVSSGVEPIFSLAYERRINPDLPHEYSVTVFDESLYWVFGDEAPHIAQKIANGEQVELPSYLVTSADVGVAEKSLMLFAFNSNIDMNSSTTINLSRDIQPLDLQLARMWNHLPLYVATLYQRFLDERIDVRPIVEKILSTSQEHYKAFLHFMSTDPSAERDYYQMYAHLPPQKGLEYIKTTRAYERAMEVIQAVSDFYLLANALRIKGVTVYVENTRRPVVKKARPNQLAFSVSLDVGKEHGTINAEKSFTAKGYYIDEDGKARCPVCGAEVKLESGCATCTECGWSACL